MAKPKKTTKVRDLKPSKDTKGGGLHFVSGAGVQGVGVQGKGVQGKGVQHHHHTQN
jgi:hypothetical protein